jgi:hypothetical protein
MFGPAEMEKRENSCIGKEEEYSASSVEKARGKKKRKGSLSLPCIAYPFETRHDKVPSSQGLYGLIRLQRHSTIVCLIIQLKNVLFYYYLLLKCSLLLCFNFFK